MPYSLKQRSLYDSKKVRERVEEATRKQRWQKGILSHSLTHVSVTIKTIQAPTIMTTGICIQYTHRIQVTITQLITS